MRTYDNAFELCTDDPIKVKELTIKSDLMNWIRDRMESKKLTQVQVAEILGVQQPRISRLLTGNISDFSIGWLTMAKIKLQA